MTIRSIKAIAVFCGSNHGASEEFADGARALGRALGSQGITTVYGGTTKGLMGVVADAALEAGGKVHGVITEALHQRGQSHSGLTRHEIAPTLRGRKERMVEIADAFIALPGGIGTIEELMVGGSVLLLVRTERQASRCARGHRHLIAAPIAWLLTRLAGSAWHC
jgi:uncharacterized protein (TIGR00730 family)